MKRVILMVCFLMAATSLYAGNGDMTIDGNLEVGNRKALTQTYWGYSPSYRTLMIGSPSTDYSNQAVTISFNYDPVINANSSFTGRGNEIIFRNGTQFVTPNDSNTVFNLSNLVLKDGKVGIGTITPSESLDVSGRVRFSNTQIWDNEINRYNNDNLYIGYRNTANTILQANGGHVGIGATNLDHPLTVAGTIWANGYLQLSDMRVKKNILPVDGALGKILKLNGVSYEWKHDKDFEGETLEALKADEDGKIKDEKYRNLPEGRTLGVIAQELEQVLPEAVNTGSDGVKAVEYTKIIPVLIEAIKEQQKKINDLEVLVKKSNGNNP